LTFIKANAGMIIACCILISVLISNVSFLSSAVLAAAAEDVRSTCTGGWYITSYFRPLESDYKSVRTKTVNVQGYGR
jgi:hypothetical protein